MSPEFYVTRIHVCVSFRTETESETELMKRVVQYRAQSWYTPRMNTSISSAQTQSVLLLLHDVKYLRPCLAEPVARKQIPNASAKANATHKALGNAVCDPHALKVQR